MALFIIGRPELEVRRGNFNIRVRKGRLEIPQQLFQALQAIGIKDAEMFYDSVYRKPELVYRAIVEQIPDWSIDDNLSAAFRLQRVLDGHVPDGLLYPLGRPACMPARDRSKAKPKRAHASV